MVGPNASGKTQLLNDIYQILIGQKRELVVADEIRFKKPDDLEFFLGVLQEKGYIKRTVVNGNDTVEKVVHNFGIGKGGLV